ncbi:MAG: peptidoglycan-binding protein LysM, partial [Tannerella sp.]|nr:peptidoglycan-binding protein LysM [Tannerella sp.]
VFVDTQDKDEQSDFIKVFKRELNERKISSTTIVHNNSDFESKIIGALSKTKPNVVIPFSASIESLNKIKTVLRSIIQTKPDYTVTLFGYPKWQTYYKDCLDDFHELNTYIYSLFYADNMDPAVKQFYDNYKNWYSKSPMPSFPKYAMLGFDTGMFFLGALQKYGENFETNISKMKYKSVQTGFNFERVNNWGGFINTNIYMIHFNKDFTITRSDFK